MNISMIDSDAQMRRVLNAPQSQRADAIRTLWEPMGGMFQFVPGGLDMVRVHEQNFGFPTDDSSRATVEDALRRLEEADAWRRIEAALETGIAAVRAADPEATIPDLTVLLVLGDPTNAHFMDEVQGLTAFGGISGFIVITIWPTERVLERLEAIAVHELHHNLRYSPGGVVWNPQTVTVGEQVVAEGLADVFASELYGPAGLTHFVSDETRADDDVLAKVVGGLDVTGMENFGGWVLGDATAKLFGGTPVGLPTGAGYAAGARLVTAYLEATGTTAAQSVRVPAADILGVALPRLGR